MGSGQRANTGLARRLAEPLAMPVRPNRLSRRSSVGASLSCFSIRTCEDPAASGMVPRRHRAGTRSAATAA